MKKFLFLAVLLACLLGVSAPAIAENTPTKLFDVVSVLNQFEHSVLLVEKYAVVNEEIKYTTKGCCVCVAKDGDKYMFLTARHVVENGVKLRIVDGPNDWEVTEWKALEDTDAAYFYITQTNWSFRPIPIELSPASNTIPSISIGMWAGTRSITGTFGFVNRTVRGAWSDRVYDYRTVYGLIEGTALIYPGFSGGALVDEFGNLLGINVLLGGRRTSFVDARYIWNSIPALNKGQRVKLPISNDFDTVGIPSLKRIPFKNSDTVSEKKLKGKIGDLIQVINNNPALVDQIINENTIIETNGGIYRVSRIEFESNTLKISKNYPYKTNFQYLYVVGKDWALTIYLGEIS